MNVVFKNIELCGLMMGFWKEFVDMVCFVNEKNFKFVILWIVSGMENLEGINSLFEDMKSGS